MKQNFFFDLLCQMKWFISLSLHFRYEFEKKRYSYLKEHDLKSKLIEAGSNYSQLLKHHDEHYRSLDRILNTLHLNNIQTKIIQRQNYLQSDIDWSDAILTG